MSEVKFRGLDLMTGEWVYGKLLNSNFSSFIVMMVNTIGGDVISSLVYHQVNQESIGQFTGLHDKAGMEIFEGDVVKYSFKDGDSVNTRVMEVFNDGLAFKLREIYRDYWLEMVDGVLLLKHGHLNKYYGELQQMMKTMSGIYSYEVIGNVQEHPELLEESHES